MEWQQEQTLSIIRFIIHRLVPGRGHMQTDVPWKQPSGMEEQISGRSIRGWRIGC